jgi:hypothetical protein
MKKVITVLAIAVILVVGFIASSDPVNEQAATMNIMKNDPGRGG